MNHEPNEPVWPPAPTTSAHHPSAPERRLWLTPKTWLGLLYGFLGYGFALVGTFVLFLMLVLLMGGLYRSDHALYMIVGAVKDFTWDYQRFVALAPILVLSSRLWKRSTPLAIGILVGGFLGIMLLWLLFPPHMLASD